MDLLGDFLLFGLGPEQGPLLFGAAAVQQTSQPHGAGTRASRPYQPTTRHADVLTFAEQAADDDEVAAALITMLAQVRL